MTGILLVSFGTTREEARQENIEALAEAYREAYAGKFPVWQAYTSPTVRRILSKRGIEMPDVTTALEKMAQEGISDVVVQPSHLLYGEDYQNLCKEIDAVHDMFHSLVVAKPLLAGTDDLRAVAQILKNRYPIGEGECLILMGHGSAEFANCVYPALQAIFREQGSPHIWVGAVEAYPDLEVILRAVKKEGYRRAILAPLMLVAGDHAANDMAGEEQDSWKSRLEAEGVAVDARLCGLGGLEEIHKLYLTHTEKAIASLGI